MTDSEITKTGLRRLVARKEVAYFCHLRSKQPNKEVESWPDLSKILEKYENILAEPAELPQDRKTNHNINLVEGAQPVNVHPYRYPHYQKSEIENLT